MPQTGSCPLLVGDTGITPHAITHIANPIRKLPLQIRLRVPRPTSPTWWSLVESCCGNSRQSGSLRRGNLVPKLDEYLRIKDAAEYLGVCQNTLRNWEAAGKIIVCRHPVNNYRLFKVSDLNKLLKKTEQSVNKKKRKPR